MVLCILISKKAFFLKRFLLSLIEMMLVNRLDDVVRKYESEASYSVTLTS